MVRTNLLFIDTKEKYGAFLCIYAPKLVAPGKRDHERRLRSWGAVSAGRARGAGRERATLTHSKGRDEWSDLERSTTGIALRLRLEGAVHIVGSAWKLTVLSGNSGGVPST